MNTILSLDKKKWENYWYYYKIHTIAGVLIAIMLIIMLKDCAGNVIPDITMSYIGESYAAQDVGVRLKERLSPAVRDLNHDGKNELFFQSMIVSYEVKTEQDIAMQSKVMVTFASGDSQVFLLDKKSLKKFAELGAFQPLDDIAAKNNIDVNANPEIRVTAQETSEPHIYGIPLKENSLLKEAGFKTEEIYIAVRSIGEKDSPKKAVLYENVYILVDEIIRYNKK